MNIYDYKRIFGRNTPPHQVQDRPHAIALVPKQHNLIADTEAPETAGVQDITRRFGRQRYMAESVSTQSSG